MPRRARVERLQQTRRDARRRAGRNAEGRRTGRADRARAGPAADAAPAAFDAAAFAGTFSGTLPCADCSGIDTKLELKADGSYALSESYQGKKDGNFKGDGTWTAEENGKRVRLDPNSKSDDDRLFEIASKDEIRMLDTEGKPIESQLNYSLKRAP
ncbi:copper resistance protein NlpE [Lysobacter enzymogenes]|nr:copper resistance protein NlpE [Lysobacter enzymogenes]